MKHELTDLEKDVCDYILYDYTDAQIAEKLKISKRTVSYNVQSAFSKLGIHGRARALRIVYDPIRRRQTAGACCPNCGQLPLPLW